MNSRIGLPLNTAEIFRVTAILPAARNNAPQYRIRNDEELHERVAAEDSLEHVVDELATAAAGDKGNTDHGQGTEAQQPRNPQTEAGEGSAEA